MFFFSEVRDYYKLKWCVLGAEPFPITRNVLGPLDLVHLLLLSPPYTCVSGLLQASLTQPYNKINAG